MSKGSDREFKNTLELISKQIELPGYLAPNRDSRTIALRMQASVSRDLGLTPGEYAKFVDPDGRRGLILCTRFGNCIAYDRSVSENGYGVYAIFPGTMGFVLAGVHYTAEDGTASIIDKEAFAFVFGALRRNDASNGFRFYVPNIEMRISHLLRQNNALNWAASK